MMSYNTDRTRIEEAYMKVCESSATDRYDELVRSINRLESEQSKARLWGEREKSKSLGNRIEELKRELSNAENDVNAEKERELDDVRTENRIFNAHSDAEMMRAAIANRIGGIGSSLGITPSNAMDSYIGMRNNGLGVRTHNSDGTVTGVDHDALSDAKSKVRGGDYSGALDDIARDYVGQFGFDYDSATNNAAYQNIKSNLKYGIAPTANDISNALGALNRSSVLKTNKNEFEKVTEAYRSMIERDTEDDDGETGELYPGEFAKMRRERKLREIDAEEREERIENERIRRLVNARRGILPIDATKEEQDEYERTLDTDEMDFVRKSRQDIWNHLRSARQIQMAKDREYIGRNYKPEVAAAAEENGVESTVIRETD